MTAGGAQISDQRTAIVTSLLGRSIWNRRTGTAGPEAMPRGTRTRTWLTPGRLGALVMDKTEAMRPPIATRGTNTLSERPVQVMSISSSAAAGSSGAPRSCAGVEDRALSAAVARQRYKRRSWHQRVWRVEFRAGEASLKNSDASIGDTARDQHAAITKKRGRMRRERSPCCRLGQTPRPTDRTVRRWRHSQQRSRHSPNSYPFRRPRPKPFRPAAS